MLGWFKKEKVIKVMNNLCVISKAKKNSMKECFV